MPCQRHRKSLRAWRWPPAHWCVWRFSIQPVILALADVAKALEGIRTATYDVTIEMINPTDGKTTSTKMKAYFEMPSQERVETLDPGDEDKVASVMILDHQAMKALTLAPEQKMAMLVDLTRIKKPAGKPSNPFDMVREFVQEENSPAVKSLGKKEIDGRMAVGFRTQSNMVDTDFWADPNSARLVRVDFEYPGHGGHGVMDHFRYDVELDPKLFSREPPEGYTVNNVEIAMPVEADFVSTLRMIAEHNDGMFPAALGMTNKDYLHAIQEVSKEEIEAFIKQPETQKLMEKLKAQYANDQSAFMKAWMGTMMPYTQKLVLKYQQGMNFYNILGRKTPRTMPARTSSWTRLIDRSSGTSQPGRRSTT